MTNFFLDDCDREPLFEIQKFASAHVYRALPPAISSDDRCLLEMRFVN